jgi:hypothetical protein
MPIEKSFHHVKEHLGDKIARNNLQLEAQLNVDADAEAGEYHFFLHPEPQPHLARLPSNAAQLNIRVWEYPLLANDGYG